MSWTYVICTCIGGAIGLLIGAYASRAIHTPIVGRSILVLSTTIFSVLGHVYLSRVAMLEAALHSPYAGYRSLVLQPGLSPWEVRWELMQAMNAGGFDLFQEKAQKLWSRRVQVLRNLIANADDEKLNRLYTALGIILRRAQQQDPELCADWVIWTPEKPLAETGATSAETEEFRRSAGQILGLSQEEFSDPLQLQSIVFAAQLQNANKKLREEASRLDLVDLLPANGNETREQRRKRYCDANVALYLDIERMPAAGRAAFIRKSLKL